MCKELFNNSRSDNFRELTATKKGAKVEVKTAEKSPMYHVNNLNRLAKKNEYVKGECIKDLGMKVRYLAIMQGKEVSTLTPFNLYVFERDHIANRVCYRKHSKTMPKWGVEIVSISEDGFEYLCPVKMTDNGFIDAYHAILAKYAKEADKECREAERTARKANKTTKADARRALAKEQSQARELFAAGKISESEFAKIMVKCI